MCIGLEADLHLLAVSPQVTLS